MLDPQMFALVDTEEDGSFYCLGIDTGEEAFTFRRDPVTRKAYFSVSANAEAAHRLHTTLDKVQTRFKLVRYPSVHDLKLLLTLVGE